MSADALPTTQIDGVAWAQQVVGNTVFVGGKFKNARPAGSAPGENTTVRRNLLSYDITTGKLNSFNPNLNAQVRVLALSPDGETLYVGGDFTRAGGETHSKIAAYDVATGALKDEFDPQLNGPVKAIAATDTTVYIGGSFTAANGRERDRLAAVTAKTGVLLGWNPGANDNVATMLLTPNGRRLVVGGNFTELGGADAYGMGLVGVYSGNAYPWAANKVVKDAGKKGAITSLSTDGNRIYGTGYDFFSDGANFEGVFAADPETGEIRWIEDCHGDSYDAYPSGDVIFVASHAHDCSTLNGFPNVDDVGHRATVFTINATRILTATKADPKKYDSFAGHAAPSLLNWFPDLEPGQFTGQSQAAWNVTGNDQYVVYGGEFPTVNGIAQEGLVRFAVRSAAPNKMGPVLDGEDFALTAESTTPGTVELKFRANWDRDDSTLTYTVQRDGVGISSISEKSSFWNRKPITIAQTDLPSGDPHSYLIVAQDTAGNVVNSTYALVTVA